jgi:hypothetical protein
MIDEQYERILDEMLGELVERPTPRREINAAAPGACLKCAALKRLSDAQAKIITMLDQRIKTQGETLVVYKQASAEQSVMIQKSITQTAAALHPSRPQEAA